MAVVWCESKNKTSSSTYVTRCAKYVCFSNLMHKISKLFDYRREFINYHEVKSTPERTNIGFSFSEQDKRHVIDERKPKRASERACSAERGGQSWSSAADAAGRLAPGVEVHVRPEDQSAARAARPQSCRLFQVSFAALFTGDRHGYVTCSSIGRRGAENLIAAGSGKKPRNKLGGALRE